MKYFLLRHVHYLLATLIVMLLTSGCWFFPDNRDDAAEQELTTAKTTTGTHPAAPGDTSETIVFEEPNPPLSEEVETVLSPPIDDRPRIAIIIDDMGYHRRIGEKLLALDLNLSFSFLPHAPFAEQQEEKAYQMGRDIMVHLPMEASDAKWDPGPGALYLSASPDDLKLTLKKNLAAVPYAIGANNHMGSRFTQNRQAMHRVLGELKKQGLFFVDSFTTARSTGMDEAQKMGIKTGRRHIFLDNVQDPKKICVQLDKLVTLAQKQNQAIGIGHPYQATLDALRNCGKQLRETVHIVPVHELVE
ncbi:MAG: divergent polysaccharide deacetylase family protein [Thermodesulfobacteriota bacterium]|nr:divergent polysaccharide deacetylase family protein [Thermodesulfobacteriota bacterium]